LERREQDIGREIGALSAESTELQQGVAAMFITINHMKDSDEKADLMAKYEVYRDEKLALVDEKLDQKESLEADLLEVKRKIAVLVE